MNEEFPVETFEFLIHMLELSVVVGIGVIVYITHKHSGRINTELNKRVKNDVDLPP